MDSTIHCLFVCYRRDDSCNNPGKQKTGKKTSLFFSDDCASRLDIFSNPTLSWLVRNHLESYNPVLAR